MSEPRERTLDDPAPGQDFEPPAQSGRAPDDVQAGAEHDPNPVDPRSRVSGVSPPEKERPQQTKQADPQGAVRITVGSSAPRGVTRRNEVGLHKSPLSVRQVGGIQGFVSGGIIPISN
jgi:hypothetical protein